MSTTTKLPRPPSGHADAPSARGSALAEEGPWDLSDVFVFLLPFTYLYQAGFIGEIYGTELVLLLLWPYYLLFSKERVGQEIRWTLRWVGFWLLALVATDIYRDTFIGDYLRGWARLIFFAIDIYVLSKLIRTERHLFLWMFSWSVATIVSTARLFDDFTTRWKFLAASVITIIAAAGLLLMWRQVKTVARILMPLCLGFGVASLFLNARNTFLNLSLSALLLAIASFQGFREAFYLAWKQHKLLLACVVMAIPYLAGQVYVQGASSGLFGEEARAKYEAQRADLSDPVVAILAGGRNEIYSSTAAIKDSPIIGYGSWARSAYYYSIYVESIHEHGTLDQMKQVDSQFFIGEPLIPTHSHIFGAWVEAGIVGAAFWIWVLWHSIVAMKRSVALTSGVDIFALILGPLFIWSILFSPFGGNMRLTEALPIIVLFGGLSRMQVSRPGTT